MNYKKVHVKIPLFGTKTYFTVSVEFRRVPTQSKFSQAYVNSFILFAGSPI